MLIGYCEKRIAQQDSSWTAIGAATGESPCCAPYQHQRTEAFLCDCGRLGTLAAAAMPPAQNSLPASAAALPIGPGAAALCDATGKSSAHCQYSIFPDRRAGVKRPGVGLGARAGAPAAVRWGQSALLYVGKRPTGLTRGRPPSGSRKRTPLAFWFAKANPVRYTCGLIHCECGGIGRRARLRTWWGNPCEFESRLSHQRAHCS
jgi:hypothetical protein